MFGFKIISTEEYCKIVGESIEILVQRAKNILFSRQPWTNEYKLKILNAIEQQDKVALIKIIKSSVIKGIIN